MGLRVKLGVYVLLFSAAVLALVGFAGLRAEANIYTGEMVRRGVTLLQSFAIPTSIAMAKHDISTLDNYLVKFGEEASQLDLIYAAVLDHQGRVVAHTDEGEFGRVYDDVLTRQTMRSDLPMHRMAERNQVRILEIAVPIESGLRWGTIRAGFSTAPVERAIQRSRERLIWSGLVIMLGATAIAYWGLSVMVIEPVLRMTAMTRRVGLGLLAARVSLRQKDEMGQLATQLNNMAEKIQTYTGSLERLVNERTQELADSNQKLRGANEQLERLARTDALTGLFNRRHFLEQLDFELRRASRKPIKMAVMMMDVDNFKHYNDTHGHGAGDEVLRQLAQILQSNLRGTDVLARYGGEEFVALLLDVELDEGVTIAKKFQEMVAAAQFPHGEQQPLGKVTISAGVCFFPADATTAEDLLNFADKAMYESKRSGRNRVTCYRDIKGQS